MENTGIPDGGSWPVVFEDLQALLWASPRATYPSAWHGHVSFAHWVVQATRPKIIVELGTHNGVSFAAFCNGVVRCGLDTSCVAVDSWEGDEHAGLYGDEVYNDLVKFQAEQFPACSKLLRCRFDEALEQFENGSIDLLHIDGCHSYEAVRHDFETWRGKLSDRAVVLLHDTEMRSRGFGVWRVWQELSDQYLSFDFQHAAGLGVLAVGPSPPPRIAALCSQRSDGIRQIVRRCFMQASDFARRNGARQISEDRETILRSVIGDRRNLALNRAASQSSGLEGSAPTPQGGVDGLKNGKFGFHTDFELQPWWMVDFGETTIFDDVVIYNRLDAECCKRARSLVVLISVDGENWTTLYVHDGTIFGGIDGFPLRIRRENSTARFVRIKLSDRQYLHLDEIEIYRDAVFQG